MKLIDIYLAPGLAYTPYQLLQEREPHQNISHRFMPTWAEHVKFVDSKPYLAWYLIVSDAGEKVGAVYLSKQREIGVGILKTHRGHGYGRKAIEELMRLHPGRFLANIAPANHESHRLFANLGFTTLQVTYQL